MWKSSSRAEWHASSFLHKLFALRNDHAGNVAMIFALLVIPLTGAIGLAIDMGRIYHVAMHTQGALDAAALAAGRVAQVERTDMLSKASKSASAFYDEAKPTDVVQTSIAFAPNALNTEFTVTATSWVKTPFLAVLDLLGHHAAESDAPPACTSTFACTKVISTATAQICLNCNGTDPIPVEIALMLDVTGSMAGSRIDDLKLAGKDLIDIVYQDPRAKNFIRTALVPFAPAINVGPYFTKITGQADREDNDGKSNRNIHYPVTCFLLGKLLNSCSNATGQKTYNKVGYIAKYAPCVVERERWDTKANKLGQYSDMAPAGAGLLNPLLPNSNLPSWNEAVNKYDPDDADQMSTNCDPSNVIVPLTNDATALKDAIGNLKTNGSTAGQLGTAFAWYMLAPSWSKVWPAESEPGAYGARTKRRKIAILMTDGEYNTRLAHQYGDGTSEAKKAMSDALDLCTAMKVGYDLKSESSYTGGPAIEIYTVGFKVNAASKANLSACATADGEHYYDASTGDALRQAFRDIALKISKLRLTN
jgi:Flp pilus assembly protein TadG